MLSVEENELITRTGPGTPMGNLFRRFWLPALLSDEIAEPNSAPVRFKVLSERLVAFRDTAGQVAIFEERCPHRHASLYWGRNEEGGLRCVYHGWKFDVTGQCIDTPAEPEGSRMKDSIHALSYASHEVAGTIWVYMGPQDQQPPFPDFEWATLPADHVTAHKRLQHCNYLQNLEGELDTAHLNFLHRNFSDGETVMPPEDLSRKHFYISETDFGMIAMARSDEPDDRYYWRMTPYMLPSFTNIPGGFTAFTAATPADDTSMWGFTVFWNYEQPLAPSNMMDVDPKSFIPVANISNDYLRDLDRQRENSFTGIQGVRTQDMAVQEDQDGPICRRWEEHLGTTDRAIVGARRLLIRLAEQLANGIEPSQPHHAEAYFLRSIGSTVKRDVNPVEVWRSGQPERQGDPVSVEIGEAF
jgi:phthalate 4,5-dioxygenase